MREIDDCERADSMQKETMQLYWAGCCAAVGCRLTFSYFPQYAYITAPANVIIVGLQEM